MEIYLVGGAVRDKLLNLPVTERDWVVVGATEQELLDSGFTPVGKDFPVFLHPKTKEEYALARTERKVGRGHRGFVCNASTDVTLEQDLLRRDLTLNALAEGADGTLIDPHGGVRDLENRLLRHVSSAFEEDPLRILRVARFASRFQGFTIHDDTIAMMKSMVQRGDLAELAPERIYAEVDKAISTNDPKSLQSPTSQRANWPSPPVALIRTNPQGSGATKVYHNEFCIAVSKEHHPS